MEIKEKLDFLRDCAGDYCFKEGCSFSKQSETYNECKFAEKCQVWQFLKWVYLNKEKEVK